MNITVNDDLTVNVTKENGQFFNLIYDPETQVAFKNEQEATACARRIAKNPFVWTTPEPEEPTE